MGLTLDFVIRPTDWLRLFSCTLGRSRLSLLFPLVALFFVVYALWHLIEYGLDWRFGLYILLAVLMGIPFIGTRAIGFGILAIMRPNVHVSIDDDYVSITSKRSKQRIPWSSFTRHGTAFEYADHFWLECGRGVAWIPKRAFETKDKMDEFRVFVAGKLPDRCKFNRHLRNEVEISKCSH